ncbi:SH3 domain-containing protein [Brevibacillus sp. M2.1A]|uniref:SH3 domain-containing protein n=1 Tax=Brevibacillus TaxID=55080 RepID=UPI00156BA960|nr:MULTISPECIES: SH3 domain-containing protein [Brevibacillus]MBY0084796.1 SH3 domain-containing protein [Brevibacillus brevis]MCC8433294.1 SH3 domain-containing protein [Brevibacillus sp. M2.1A]
MLPISPYHRSLWVRNIFLGLFALGLIAVLFKLGFGYKQITLYKQAKAFYEQKNLLQAEETFSRAHDMAVLSYGDDEWNSIMFLLTSIRTELEGLQQQSLAAISEKKVAEIGAVYEQYQAVKQKYQNQKDVPGMFFQQLSAQMGMDKSFSDYYLNALQTAKAQAQANLEKEKYQDESFIEILLAIPDEYYGGKKKKQAELTALFQDYEKTKLRKLITSAPFEEVITKTATSIRHYEKLGIETDWLVGQLEKYALAEIKEVIRSKDLSAFVDMAAAYRKIEDVLSSDSPVLDSITRYLEGKLKQAEQYIKSFEFTKARELYEQLNPLQDTATLLSDLEKLWLEYDPARLLQLRYPDRTFTDMLSGTDRWGAKLYAFGLSEADQRLYFAAKMPNDSILYLDQSLDADMKSAKAKIDDTLGTKEKPVIIVSASGKERANAYTALSPNLTKESLDKRFSVEADELSVEDSEHVIMKNAVGKGENEIALFKLEDNGLAYMEKLADLEEGSEETTEGTGSEEAPSPADGTTEATDKTPPATQKIDVFAGPGEEYEKIGQVAADGSFQVIADLNGWYQIVFDGKEGWIRTAESTP